MLSDRIHGIVTARINLLNNICEINDFVQFKLNEKYTINYNLYTLLDYYYDIKGKYPKAIVVNALDFGMINNYAIDDVNKYIYSITGEHIKILNSEEIISNYTNYLS